MSETVIDGIDLSKLDETQQKLFNLGFGKGAQKVEEEAKKTKERLEETLQLLQQTEGSKKLTEEERTQLASELKALRTAGMTTEQRHQQALNDLRSDFDTRMKQQEEQAIAWKQRHHGMIAESALTQEAVAADAFNPTQIISMLRPYTEIEEIVEEGRPARYTPKIRSTDKDGKPALVDLKQGVKDFLAQNPNLVKGNVVRGPEGGLESMQTRDGLMISKENLQDAKWVNDNFDKIKSALEKK
jgi:hypothetical protein